MSNLKAMTILGFGCKHQIRDTDGKLHKFSQTYKYIKVHCPRCKEKQTFLYPALNECNKCHCIVAFCSLNDNNNLIQILDIKQFQKNVDEALEKKENKKNEDNN